MGNEWPDRDKLRDETDERLASIGRQARNPRHGPKPRRDSCLLVLLIGMMAILTSLIEIIESIRRAVT